MSDIGKPIIHGPFEGDLVFAAGDRYRFLADKENTAGRFGLVDAVVPPGGGPPPHTHSRESESFYVLEGKMLFSIEGEETELEAGGFVHCPEGTKHTFRNHTKANARMLILVTPGGLEGMLREVGQVVSDLHDTIPTFGEDEKRKLMAAAPKYGVEVDA